jgi:putative phosphoesterase
VRFGVNVKIGLIGDVHATAAPVREALAVFRREGVDTILCPGDIAGYGTELESTVELLNDSGCRAILGNHDLWWLDDPEGVPGGAVETYLRSLPPVIELSVAGKELYMVHASPLESLMDGIRLLDENGRIIPEQRDLWTEYLKTFPFDVLVVGHTHQVFAERLGDVLVVNPGSTRFNHTCAVLSLPAMDVRFIPLGGRTPVPAWNWGMEGSG